MRSLSPKLLGDFLARTILLTRQGRAQCFTVQDHNDALYLVWRGLDVPEQRQAFYLVPVTDAVIGWLQRHLLSLAEVFAEEGFLFVRYPDGRAPELTVGRTDALPEGARLPERGEVPEVPPNTPGRAVHALQRLGERLRWMKFPMSTILQRLNAEAPALQADTDHRAAASALRRAYDQCFTAAEALEQAQTALQNAYRRAGV